MTRRRQLEPVVPIAGVMMFRQQNWKALFREGFARLQNSLDRASIQAVYLGNISNKFFVGQSDCKRPGMTVGILIFPIQQINVPKFDGRGFPPPWDVIFGEISSGNTVIRVPDDQWF